MIILQHVVENKYKYWHFSRLLVKLKKRKKQQQPKVNQEFKIGNKLKTPLEIKTRGQH